jgi:resuscitation-promoting factor RpfB
LRLEGGWRRANSIAVLVTAGLLVFLSALYLATQHIVVLDINGVMFSHRTHARSVQAVLREMGVVLQAKDILVAPSEEALAHGELIRVTVARPVVLLHDGSLSRSQTQADTVGQVLIEMGVTLAPHDQVQWRDAPYNLDAPLPALQMVAGQRSAPATVDVLRRAVRLSVLRAVTLSVQDGGIPVTLYTTGRTVGEALYEHGLTLYAADHVFPSLEAEITPGLAVIIDRSKPMTLDVAGTRTVLRTRLKTVQEVLAAEGVALGPKDYAMPDPATPVSRDLLVRIMRVADEYYVEEVPIPFQMRWEGSDALEIDQTGVSSWGHEGARRKLVRVHYENDREIYRAEEEEWIARKPQDRIHNFGTKIVLRDLETSSGTVTYWRKLRMYATSYSAATAGVSPSSPWYGRTRLGLQAGKGVVAIDPRIIALGQQLYVPGYGTAIAGDTGGGVRGRMIDLGYDDNNLVAWHQWVDVYVLTPVPPASSINWRVVNADDGG